MKKSICRLALLLLILFIIPQAAASELLIPVGEVIALELQNDQVTVAALDGDSELQVGDRLRCIDGHSIRSVQDVRAALAASDGTVEVELVRGKQVLQLKIDPRITSDGPQLGVYLRQGVTGIGTVTYFDPDTGNFGALGHGVSDCAGKLVAMERGHAYRARVLSVRRGKTGTPGQLIGALSGADPMGILWENTSCGIFGTCDGFSGQPIPTAEPSEVRTGSAVILSTVNGSSPQEYSVEILKIYPNATGAGRNLLLKVAVPQLLSTTGGIVQGMSGSPIIQDGKLIGAVTHVLVNDPTTGYGIFIENMLDAAA